MFCFFFFLHEYWSETGLIVLPSRIAILKNIVKSSWLTKIPKSTNALDLNQFTKKKVWQIYFRQSSLLKWENPKTYQRGKSGRVLNLKPSHRLPVSGEPIISSVPTFILFINIQFWSCKINVIIKDPIPNDSKQGVNDSRYSTSQASLFLRSMEHWVRMILLNDRNGVAGDRTTWMTYLVQHIYISRCMTE